jgi:hypothetical protein
MSIKSQKDFFSGLMFMSVGVAFAWGATRYTIGTSARMGPGYFPLLLGIMQAILGAVITFKANLVFGLALGGLPILHSPAFGLIAGIYALTFIASLAGEEFKLKEVAILATVLALMSYLAFILLLRLQLPVWPTFISG